MTDALRARPGFHNPEDGPPQILGNPPSQSARGSLTISELQVLYVGGFKGRDRSRLHYLARWAQVIGHLRLDQVDDDVVADALHAFQNAPAMRFLGRDKITGIPRWKELGHPSPATLNRMRSSLSALFRFAKIRRLAPKGWVNPVLEVPALPEDNERRRFLSTTERERLLAACKASGCAKLYLLVVMALSTGARRGELLSLRYGDIDLAEASAYVRRGKNGEPRVLPLTPVVVRMIVALGHKPAESLLFASRYEPTRVLRFDTAWRTALRLACVADFRFHDLRHSCASYLAQSGVSLLEIADVLGHKSLDVTRRYAHLTVTGKRALINKQFSGLGEFQ